VWLTRIGTYGAIWIALGIALAVVRRRWELAVLVIAAVAVADLAATILKDATHRRRPPLVYPEPKPLVADPHSSAFPSGHAATALAGATMLAFAFPRAAPAFYVLAAAIAYSRVYVGVHWPLDVIAGALVGVATALLLRAAVRWRSSSARRAS
jgi:undecaprenyl-diphosphatase